MSEFNKIFNKNSTINKNSKVPDINFNEFEKVITSRRSVRRFTEEPVPEDILHKALDHALLAPNSSNLQTWQFYWIKSKAIRIKLDEAFLNQPAVTTAPELIVIACRPDYWKKNSKKMADYLIQKNPKHPALSYYKKIVPLFYSLGIFNIIGIIKKIVFFCIGLKKPIPRQVTSKSDLNTWAVKSAALACENIMLSLRAQGYDSCPMEGFDSKRVKKILKLPRNSVVVMGISAGKRAQDGVFGEQLRFERDEFIFKV